MINVGINIWGYKMNIFYDIITFANGTTIGGGNESNFIKNYLVISLILIVIILIFTMIFKQDKIKIFLRRVFGK